MFMIALSQVQKRRNTEKLVLNVQKLTEREFKEFLVKLKRLVIYLHLVFLTMMLTCLV